VCCTTGCGFCKRLILLARNLGLMNARIARAYVGSDHSISIALFDIASIYLIGIEEISRKTTNNFDRQ
jgi:hypothetical protein